MGLRISSKTHTAYIPRRVLRFFASLEERLRSRPDEMNASGASWLPKVPLQGLMDAFDRGLNRLLSLSEQETSSPIDQQNLYEKPLSAYGYEHSVTESLSEPQSHPPSQEYPPVSIDSSTHYTMPLSQVPPFSSYHEMAASPQEIVVTHPGISSSGSGVLPSAGTMNSRPIPTSTSKIIDQSSTYLHDGFFLPLQPPPLSSRAASSKSESIIGETPSLLDLSRDVAVMNHDTSDIHYATIQKEKVTESDQEDQSQYDQKIKSKQKRTLSICHVNEKKIY
jgi:hypothetical protein